MNSLNNLIKLIITLRVWKSLIEIVETFHKRSELFVQWKQSKFNMFIEMVFVNDK